MSKWIAEFDLEDGDTMPEHMDLTFKGTRLDFHCRPITECEADDCISRTDAIKLLESYGSVEITNKLKELPSAYPKSDKPSGKWEQINKNETNVIPQWKCSECGAEFECFDMDFEYCPNCGCRMVEEQGEQTDG